MSHAARLRLPAFDYRRGLDRLRFPGLGLPGLAPVQSGMAQWIEARSPRERRLLVVLAGLAAVALFVTLIWRPIEAARAAAIADIGRYDQLTARLRTAGPDVARLAAARSAAPSTIVTESAGRAGLAIQRIEPQGANTSVTLDGVGFVRLLDWLAAIERDAGLRVIDLKLERRPDPGIVNAQVTLG